MTVFGTIGWVNYTIARLPLCLVPKVMSTIRAMCTEQAWDTPRSIPSEVRSEMMTLIKYAQSASLTEAHLDLEPVPDIAWSDASDRLMAGILQGLNSDLDSFVIERSDALGIFAAELCAAITGLLRWGSGSQLLMAIGNTATVAALRKGHSTTDVGDSMLRVLASASHLADTPWWLTWVPSHLERADYKTRVDEPFRPPHRAFEYPISRPVWRIPREWPPPAASTRIRA